VASLVGVDVVDVDVGVDGDGDGDGLTLAAQLGQHGDHPRQRLNLKAQHAQLSAAGDR